MSFWDGTRWIPDRTASRTRNAPRHRARDWFATFLMLVGLAAVILPGAPTEAAPARLSASPLAARPGELLRVSGRGFRPTRRFSSRGMARWTACGRSESAAAELSLPA